MTRILVSLALCVPAFADVWQIDTAHSKAQFSVRHMMVTTVRGQFGKLTGTVNYDSAKPAASSVQAEVDTSTVDTQQAKRDAHLRSADFFDVEKFPAIKFLSTKIESAGGRFRMTGDLTIHGVTKPVVFDIEGPNGPVKDGRGERLGATATAKISRKDFGMTWNRVLEAGGVTVSDDVTITVDVELTKR